MIWPFSIYSALYTNYPKERYIWAKIRILHETNKAVLVDNGRRFWISKSRIYRIRLRKDIFEIYTTKSSIR